MEMNEVEQRMLIFSMTCSSKKRKGSHNLYFKLRKRNNPGFHYINRIFTIKIVYNLKKRNGNY